jgi:hypothetical protein
MFRQVTVSGYPAIALRSAELEVVVVPAIGMRITNLRRLRGREWLWRNDQIPLAAPRAGASYSETADFGGWDESFPSGGASHGELWSASWSSSVYEHSGGTTLRSSVQGTALGYQFQRELSLDPHEPVLRLSYVLRHLGDAPFAWVWSAYPLFNVQPGTIVNLPTVTQMRVGRVFGPGPNESGADMMADWLGGLRGEGRSLILSAESGWAIQLFGDVGTSGRLSLTDPRRGERFELVVNPAEVAQAGVWINARGWAPPARTPYYNLSLQPCIGSPEDLPGAVRRGSARTLSPGEEYRWGLEVWLRDEND